MVLGGFRGGRGREFVERLRVTRGILDVVTRQCDLDERRSERAQPKTVAAGRVEPASCDGLGEVEFTSGDVRPRQYLARAGSVLERPQELSGLLDTALHQANRGKPDSGFGAMRVDGGALRTERLQQGGSPSGQRPAVHSTEP